jgi:hypothetical protein
VVYNFFQVSYSLLCLLLVFAASFSYPSLLMSWSTFLCVMICIMSLLFACVACDMVKCSSSLYLVCSLCCPFVDIGLHNVPAPCTCSTAPCYCLSSFWVSKARRSLTSISSYYIIAVGNLSHFLEQFLDKSPPSSHEKQHLVVRLCAISKTFFSTVILDLLSSGVFSSIRHNPSLDY